MTGLAPPPIKAIVFDVFGTVVDWRGSLVRELEHFGAARKLDADWADFADAWRRGYRPAMARVERGELPWTPVDALHRGILDELLAQRGLARIGEAERDHLNRKRYPRPADDF